tara:strand:+ start:834 stop:1028 length:195 start_codon:yes stop_codon:yes gene_type:complete
MNDEQLVIEIKRGGVGMRQVVDEDGMRQETNREDRLKWLFWRCYEAFEGHEFEAIEKQVMNEVN